MKLKSIKLKNFANTKRWKKLEKKVNKSNLFFRLGHLNPEVNIDPIKGKANKVIKQEKKGNVIETTSTVGIYTKKGGMTEFYESMLAAVKVGYLPGFTVSKINNLRKNINKVMPEECDFWTDISVADYGQKKISFQALKNISDQFTKGFANVPVPGASRNMTLKEVFKNPLVRAEAKKQGVSEAEIDKTLEEIKKVSQQAIKQTHKSNVKYELGKFGKYPAVYCIPPITTKPKQKRKKKSKYVKIKSPNGAIKKLKVGGGSDTRIKLPPNAFKKENYPIDGNILQAIQVERYLISGSILTALHYMPSGKLFCQSLTKFKTKTETTHEGKMTFIDHFIIPENSNLKKEGYLNREGTRSMILKLISLL